MLCINFSFRAPELEPRIGKTFSLLGYSAGPIALHRLTPVMAGYKYCTRTQFVGFWKIFYPFRNLRYKSNHIQQDFYIVHLFFLTHSILPEITAKMAAQSFALASRVTIQRPSIALPAARRPHARSIVSRPVQSKLSGPKPSSNNNNNRPNIFAVRLPKWDDIQQLPLMPIVS